MPGLVCGGSVLHCIASFCVMPCWELLAVGGDGSIPYEAADNLLGAYANCSCDCQMELLSALQPLTLTCAERTVCN